MSVRARIFTCSRWAGWQAVWVLGLVLLLCGVAVGADTLASILSNRIALCLHTLIPSLFAGMAVSDLLVQSGCVGMLGNWLQRPAKWLRWSPEYLGVYLLSQLAGYPVGALLLRQSQASMSPVTRSQTRLSAAAFGGGPAFVVGLVGVRLTGSASIGWLLLGCCFFGNTIVAYWLRPLVPAPAPQLRTDAQLHPTMLTDSATHAMRGLCTISAVVCAFGGITWLLTQCGLMRLLTVLGATIGLLPHQTVALVTCVLDITQLEALCQSGLPCAILLPLLAGLLSFGGVCVQWQCLALGAPGMRWREYLSIRLLAMLCSAAICRLLLPFLPQDAVVATIGESCAISKSESILPGLLILCTGFPLLFKKD